MAGWVLVVSLLFSPGMLPAERPSHLYLNLIPLCFGCSMISMKGLAVWTDAQAKAREEEEEEECDLNAVFWKHKNAVSRLGNTACLHCFTWISVSTQKQLCHAQSERRVLKCVYSWKVCSENISADLKQNTGHLQEIASYLGWVGSGPIHTHLWWTENKKRHYKSLQVLQRLVVYHLQCMTQHTVAAQMTNAKSCFQNIFVV